MIYLAFTQEKMYAGIRGRITELLSLGKNYSIDLCYQDLPDAFSHLLPMVEEAIHQYAARTQQPLLAHQEAVLLLPDDIDPDKLARIQESFEAWRKQGWELSLGSLVPADAFAEENPQTVSREIRAYIREYSPPVLVASTEAPTSWGINTWEDVQLQPATPSPGEAPSRRPLIWGGIAFATVLVAGIWVLSDADSSPPPISHPQLADASPASMALPPSGELETVTPVDTALLTPADTLTAPTSEEEVPVAEPEAVLAPLIAAADPVQNGETVSSVSWSDAKGTATPVAKPPQTESGKPGTTAPPTTTPSVKGNPTVEATTTKPSTEEPSAAGIRDRLETEAVFPGGAKALEAYLRNEVRYPKAAKRRNLTGTVRVQFEIDIEGRVTNAFVDQSLGYGCDEEALRLVQQMPDWQPATKMRKRIPKSYAVLVPFGE